MKVFNSFGAVSILFLGASLFSAAFADADSSGHVKVSVSALVARASNTQGLNRVSVRVDFDNLSRAKNDHLSCSAVVRVTEEEGQLIQGHMDWKRVTRVGHLALQSRIIAPGQQDRVIQFAYQGKASQAPRRGLRAELVESRCSQALPEIVENPARTLQHQMALQNAQAVSNLASTAKQKLLLSAGQITGATASAIVNAAK